MRIGRSNALAALASAILLISLPLGLATPPAPSGPAQSGCVACHTSRALLEPLVPPVPPLPAEGEG